ncbi:MAG: RNase T-like 3' exoribonuclease [Podoviridae sp. ctpVR23]|nr:MAG: RNase T-like 3' exoribonuclease [Podoviridae sp. ctpVR23]
MADIHFMLDLETMSLAPNAAIVSIGAVSFDFNSHILREFKVNVDLCSCKQVGLDIDPNTVMWWLSQPKESQQSLMSADIVDIETALNQLMVWMCEHRVYAENFKVWGNGAMSDNIWIDQAFKACKIHKPWTHRDDMCFRTIKAMYPKIEISDELVQHDALCDARWQARYLLEIAKIYW